MLDVRNIIILLLTACNLALLTFLCGSKTTLQGETPSVLGSALDLVVADANSRNYRTPYESYHVKNTITKHMPRVRQCYLAYLEKNQAASGDAEIYMDWHIAPNGQGHEAGVISSNVSDEQFPSCIRDEINTWKFPPPPSGRPSYSSFTFNFKKAT